MSAGVRGEAVRFGVVGGGAFVVDLAAFNLLRLTAGVGPLTSKVLAVLVATTFSYVVNRAWTFGHREAPRRRGGVARQYLLFSVLNAVGLGIALVCLGVAYYLLDLRSTLDQNVSGNGIGLVLGTMFRFWAYRRWVFPAPADPAFDPVAELAEELTEEHAEEPEPAGVR